MSSVTNVYISTCVYRVHVLSSPDYVGLLRWLKCDVHTDNGEIE